MTIGKTSRAFSVSFVSRHKSEAFPPSFLIVLNSFSKFILCKKKKKLSEAKINPPIWFTAAHLSSAHGNKVPLLSKRNEKRG